ncbi:UNVERIFIED_CONTAM: hypothetical protein RMT77_017620 [Armadillidium vulgare]
MHSSKKKTENKKHIVFSSGIVCTKVSCDWSVDSTCKNGTFSEVLQWETDIFEIGFDQSEDRPREVVIRIDLNEDYYIEIKVISGKGKRTLKIILNECSHTEKQCLENRNFTLHDLNIKSDRTLVAIGFRKDEKMNFAAVSESKTRATNLFGRENEYEFKTPGFYFNTNETMNITVYSKFDENFVYDGFRMYLPTSVGGLFFKKDGYLVHDKYSCDTYYNNPDNEKGLAYIIREYFNNSENWKAPPVKWTRFATVPYFDENGMKVERDQMLVKERKNPNFDAKKMRRKGCKYVEKRHIDTTTLKEESTLREIEATETTIPDDLTEESVSTPKLDSSETNINLNGEKHLKIDDDQLDSEKDKLMKEFFRIEIFKTKLEILELETKLGLPRSKFTKELSDNFMMRSTSNVLEDY